MKGQYKNAPFFLIGNRLAQVDNGLLRIRRPRRGRRRDGRRRRLFASKQIVEHSIFAVEERENQLSEEGYYKQSQRDWKMKQGSAHSAATTTRAGRVSAIRWWSSDSNRISVPFLDGFQRAKSNERKEEVVGWMRDKDSTMMSRGEGTPILIQADDENESSSGRSKDTVREVAG